jgi:hypothetical protein
MIADRLGADSWVPAFAGMTEKGDVNLALALLGLAQSLHGFLATNIEQDD